MMTLEEMNEPILVEESRTDSRSLIMPHQQEAVEALTDYFKLDEDIPDRNGILVMPTGSGKTYTAVTWLLSQGVAKGYQVAWLVHRQELVEQTYQEFRKQVPILKGTGIDKIRVLPVSGVHMSMSMASRANVYVCSIASVANKYGYRFIKRMLGEAGKRKLIICIDEAHHATAASYQKVLKRMTNINANRVLLGLTATPKRMQESEQRKLQQMFSIDRNLLNGIGMHGYVYEVTLKQLLISGYLAKPVYERVDTQIVGEIEYDCTPEDEKFFKRYGELSEKLKNQIARSSSRNKIIVEQYIKKRKEYGKTLIFAVNQLHAETLCNDFRKAGVSCDYAVSSRKDAPQIIQAFKENKIDVLINVQILTEGSDVPDIQSVFLTRQTNSDSLLMQMIGRGLRGKKVGGTETANIVSFHDTWNTFAHWLDPGALDVFDEEDLGEEIVDEDEVAVNPDEEMTKLLHEQEIFTQEIEKSPSDREIYLKLYQLMKAPLRAENEMPVYPCGWYSVTDKNGDNSQILVFDCQLSAYGDMERNIKQIKGKLDGDAVRRFYFDKCIQKPEVEELDYIIDYIEETDTMPPYFTFEMRNAVDPDRIAQKLSEMFDKDEEREEWLKKLYDHSSVLQEIYHVFFAFKKTVYDAMKPKTEAEIETADDREKYEVVDNYYDLQELLEEVQKMFPLLRTDGLVKLAWSESVEKSWFGLCVREPQEGGEVYQIYINRMLSSPEIDREVIKYLIYHELLHQNGYWRHDSEFRKKEWQYPNSAELDGILDSLALRYDMDELMKNAVNSGMHWNDEPPEEAAAEMTDEGTKAPTGLKDDTEKQPLPEGVQPGYKYCRNCGNKLPVSANFCDKCGKSIDY